MRTLIIGAGIGGLTTALALQQKGIDVDVYERSAVLSETDSTVRRPCVCSSLAAKCSTPAA